MAPTFRSEALAQPERIRRRPEFKAAVEREFPEGASVLQDPVGRRSFIGLMGASLGLAGLAGCRKPEGAHPPVQQAPGGRSSTASRSSTRRRCPSALRWSRCSSRATRAVRPRLKAIPRSARQPGVARPPIAQASVLDLYDPDRSTGTAGEGRLRRPQRTPPRRTGRASALSLRTVRSAPTPTAEKASRS